MHSITIHVEETDSFHPSKPPQTIVCCSRGGMRACPARSLCDFFRYPLSCVFLPLSANFTIFTADINVIIADRYGITRLQHSIFV